MLRESVLQSRYRLLHYAYLTRRTSHFLYAYHIRHSPYVTITVRTPTLCLLDTSDKSFFFMPTIFVAHLMLDSYGQPHFLTYTVPCPLPLFYIWFLPYYEYGTIPLFTNTYVPLYLHVYKPI